MEQLRVQRERLLTKLEDNLEKHEVDFEAALAGWKEDAAAALKEAWETAASTGKITLNPLADLPKPSSYTKSYEDAIERVRWSEDEYLVLDDHEFASWVQDNWNWRGAFLSNTTQYSVGR